MDMDSVRARGLVLLGCGKMGSALLQGWLAGGVPPAAVTVLDPQPSDWLAAQPVRLNAELPADAAIVLAYGGRAVDVWWEQMAPEVARFDNLTVLRLGAAEGEALAALAARNMQLNCTIQEGTVWLACGENSVEITLETLLSPAE